MNTIPSFIVLVCATFPLLMGGLAIVGWYTRSPSLFQFRANFVPMQFNTAIGFIVCGVGLWLMGHTETQGVHVAGVVILLVGGLTLFEYATRIDCGIDQLFLKHYITVGTSHPGRMAPNTAVCFILTAAAFLISANPQHSMYEMLMSGILGASILAFGTIALMGYILRVQPAYGWGHLTRMALPTALGFGCVGVGLLAFSCCVWLPFHVTTQAEVIAVVSFVGIVLASLLTIVVYYYQRERYVRQELQVSHSGLVKEIQERKEAEQEVRGSREELRSLSNRLQVVREQEKTQIAREVHDELGQALTALKMDLTLLEEELEHNSENCRKKIQEMAGFVDETVRSVQDICFRLRPKILDLLGLPEAMEFQARDFETRTGILCIISSDSEPTPLDSSQMVGLFRVFQEALSNVARHANASVVRVELTYRERSVELVVKDDGIGITATQIKDSRSLGLIGMRERMFHLGGTMSIQGYPGQGTGLRFVIPRRNS